VHLVRRDRSGIEAMTSQGRRTDASPAAVAVCASCCASPDCAIGTPPRRFADETPTRALRVSLFLGERHALGTGPSCPGVIAQFPEDARGPCLGWYGSGTTGVSAGRSWVPPNTGLPLRSDSCVALPRSTGVRDRYVRVVARGASTGAREPMKESSAKRHEAVASQREQRRRGGEMP